jgi:hypothetical protein
VDSSINVVEEYGPISLVSTGDDYDYDDDYYYYYYYLLQLALHPVAVGLP